MEEVILVDIDDQEIWTMEKLEAHKKWLLHRAFSVFIFNDKKELLLQQRAMCKYHNPWIWTNTVCSHQRIWENNLQASKRRLNEEVWITAKNLSDIDHIIYKSVFSNGLTEHEYDYIIFWMDSWDTVQCNSEEVMNYKWISIPDLKKEIIKSPNTYSSWMKIIIEKQILEKVHSYIDKYKSSL